MKLKITKNKDIEQNNSFIYSGVYGRIIGIIDGGFLSLHYNNLLINKR